MGGLDKVGLAFGEYSAEYSNTIFQAGRDRETRMGIAGRPDEASPV